MNKSKKDIAELIGMFAIVVSLIFVGLQLRLERKVALAEQYFNRGESLKEDYRALLLSSEYFKVSEDNWARNQESFYSDRDWVEMEQVRNGTRSISSVELKWLFNKLQSLGFDNLYFQYKQGLIDEETWIGLRVHLKHALSSDKMTSDIFTEGARANLRPVINEILAEIESERLREGETANKTPTPKK